MKAKAMKIAEGVYWVGTLHWQTRTFHGFAINGTTYNCYLVFGQEKVALIDNVFEGMYPQLEARIKNAFMQEGRSEVKIDVFIQNHSEKDHSYCLAQTLEQFPEAEIYSTKNCENFLKGQYEELKDVEFNTVQTGDEISLGGKTFTFFEAQMLHWPDSMFTMLKEDGILFSNDAFGQHLCTSQRYAEELDLGLLTQAAQKYYANLVAFGSPSLRMKLDQYVELGLLDNTNMIAPCHGLIWKNPQTIIDLYTKWGTGVCKDKITIIYDTMHHATEKMAIQIAEGIMSEDVEVVMYYMENDTADDVVSDVLDSKAIAVGSPTMMNKAYPRIGNALLWLGCINYPATTSIKKALIFSSKGWGGGAIPKIQAELEEGGFEIFDTYEAVFTPTEDDLEECYNKGKQLAKAIKDN
ncbi:MAG: MBL fold metallo-hydrolase [Methanosphaera sp. rholeuAM74]|nr:MAG: MBL fold metallo-hydrolase [Methanosphaera sp. rholeuAM74]